MDFFFISVQFTSLFSLTARNEILVFITTTKPVWLDSNGCTDLRNTDTQQATFRFDLLSPWLFSLGLFFLSLFVLYVRGLTESIYFLKDVKKMPQRKELTTENEQPLVYLCDGFFRSLHMPSIAIMQSRSRQIRCFLQL